MKHLQPLVFVFCLLALHQNGMSQTIPNNDFETWSVRTQYEPDSGWVTSNDASLLLHDTLTVWKVPGVSGQAVHMQTAIIGTDTMNAYVVNTNNAGVPYTGQPSAITGYYRYNLPGNDSAILFVGFYKAGAVLATNIFHIRGTGSLSTFTPFSLPLLPMAMAPDTVIIEATSSNLVSGVGIESGSWLELDQLAFTGTTSPVIVGGSFDSWTGFSNEKPVGWVSGFGTGAAGISRSTDHYSGSYSAKLETYTSSFGPTPAVMIDRNGTSYTSMIDTLTGYYKYTETGGDSGFVKAYLYHTGSPVGSATYTFHPASSWTYFELPVIATSTPDTMLIGFVSGTGAPGLMSTLNVDHLKLKSQTSGVPFAAAGGAVAYPNPAAADLYIRTPQGMNCVATITVFDAAGRNVGQWYYNMLPSTVTIPVGALTAGVYIYEVRAGEIVYKGNFIKK